MPDAGVTTGSPALRSPGEEGPSRWRNHAVTAGFLAPALIFLSVWIVYPALDTLRRSFMDQDSQKYVGIDNYKQIFQSDFIVTAIKNNAIWIAVVPAHVTANWLIFAVLTERIGWAVAFKTVVFMPMAISLFASGVIWRIMDEKDPNRGAVNAVVGAVHDEFKPPGVLSDAVGSTDALAGSPQQALVLKTPLRPGSVARLGLTAIPPADVPGGAAQAVEPKPIDKGIAGVVWRDFKPGGGVTGKVETGELGLPA